MKAIIIFIGLCLISSFSYADRVCLNKTTGKLIEYQSGDALLGILTQNAVNSGYKSEDVEEKYITKEEWLVIKEEQIDRPAREEKIRKEQERKEKEERVKIKLNLSNNDFKDLKDALRD